MIKVETEMSLLHSLLALQTGTSRGSSAYGFPEWNHCRPPLTAH